MSEEDLSALVVCENLADLSLNGGSLQLGGNLEPCTELKHTMDDSSAHLFKITSLDEFSSMKKEDIPKVFMDNVDMIFTDNNIEVVLTNFDVDTLMPIRASIAKVCMSKFSEIASLILINRQTGSKTRIVSDILAMGWSLVGSKLHHDVYAAFRKQSGRSLSAPNSPARPSDHSPNLSAEITECKILNSPPSPLCSPAETKFQNIEKSLKKVSSEICQLVHNTTAIMKGQETMDKRLHTMEADIRSIKSDCRSNRNSIKELENRVGTLEEQPGTDDLKERISYLEENQTALSEKIASDILQCDEFQRLSEKVENVPTLDNVQTKLDAMTSDIQTLTNELQDVRSQIVARTLEEEQKEKEPTPFDPDTTVVVIGLNKLPHENHLSLCTLAQQVVHSIDPTLVTMMKAVKRQGDMDGRRGIVKIQFNTNAEKVALLKGSRRLRYTQEFSKLYVRTSMSHESRLIEQNFKTLLTILPQLQGSIRVDSTGRLIPALAGIRPPSMASYTSSRPPNQITGQQQASYTSRPSNQTTGQQQTSGPPLPHRVPPPNYSLPQAPPFVQQMMYPYAQAATSSAQVSQPLTGTNSHSASNVPLTQYSGVANGTRNGQNLHPWQLNFTPPTGTLNLPR